MYSSGFDDHPQLPLLKRKIGPFLFGFGKKNLSFDQLVRNYREFKWAHLKQIHSDTIVESASGVDLGAPNENLIEADAHFTTQKRLGLVVKSADCVPVLIACASGVQPPAVCAIHAGWRGVQQDIVTKTVRSLLEKGFAPTGMHVAIGPHIRQKSFEVHLDVALELKRTAMRAGLDDLSKIITPHPYDASKRNIDLEAIVIAQLKNFQITNTAIDTCGEIDTLSSPEWSSYRRDAANAGRNLSFIGLDI